MSEKNSWESMKSDIGTGLEVAGFMLACYFLAPVIVIIGLYIFLVDKKWLKTHHNILST